MPSLSPRFSVTRSPFDPSAGRAGLAPGDTVAERYRIERPVGAGGMGTVYLATDLELSERVALKTLRPDLVAQDETAMERFRNEIRLARRITHRNIVRTHDFGRSGDTLFVTMEFVEGTTLRAVIDQRGTLGASAVIAIGRQLADALASAHELGIVHRDIKPQNLLLDSDGSIKVMDFGVARLARNDTRITQAGTLVGTPAYMAPEQLLDEDVDARSDLYAMGVVLYECLTGRPPYEAKSPIALIGKILSGGATPIDRVAPNVLGSVSSVVMRLLARDPADRVPSAAALRETLASMS